MNPYDLLEMLKEYCNGDLKELVETTHELIEEIENNNFLHRLEGDLNELCEDNNICCKCGSYLTNNIEYEESEYLGQTVKEEINNLVCIECM